MLARVRLALTLFGFAPIVAAHPTQAQFVGDGRVEFTEWARRNALTFPSSAVGSANDSDWIARLTRDATVLGIGESAHDVHDFLALRIVFTERLIEQGRVATVVMETSFVDAAAVNAWLGARLRSTKSRESADFRFWPGS